VNPVSGMLNRDLQISRQGFSGPGIDHKGCEPGHFNRQQISRAERLFTRMLAYTPAEPIQA